MTEPLKGKILKGIGGFYYVCTDEGTFQCRARGIFRDRNKKPLAGDDVLIELTQTEDVEGYVTQILERKNSLIRPPVANIDQALVIFSIHDPEPVWGLLDRFLINMAFEEIPCIICINKDDLKKEEEGDRILKAYAGSGVRLIFTSAKDKSGLKDLKALLKGKTTTVAGPSGAGKSSLINCLLGDSRMETGQISQKIKRGKQTTRHTELLSLGHDTFIFDSPGFSSLEPAGIKKEELRDYYHEFIPYNPQCRYNLCLHMSEPDCAVKNAVNEGLISSMRYESYRSLLEEISARKRYT